MKNINFALLAIALILACVHSQLDATAAKTAILDGIT